MIQFRGIKLLFGRNYDTFWPDLRYFFGIYDTICRVVPVPSVMRVSNQMEEMTYGLSGITGVRQAEGPKIDPEGASCFPARVQISADKPWENICSRLVSHIKREGGIS